MLCIGSICWDGKICHFIIWDHEIKPFHAHPLSLGGIISLNTVNVLYICSVATGNIYACYSEHWNFARFIPGIYRYALSKKTALFCMFFRDLNNINT